MPRIIFHKHGKTFTDDVADNTNLVVRAAIKRFPFPHLAYGCGMGKCGKCACLILSGAEHLPEPNWKETQRLGPQLDDGYRLICQLWLTNDLELAQNAPSSTPPDVTGKPGCS
jgi:ferredoxin